MKITVLNPLFRFCFNQNRIALCLSFSSSHSNIFVTLNLYICVHLFFLCFDCVTIFPHFQLIIIVILRYFHLHSYALWNVCGLHDRLISSRGWKQWCRIQTQTTQISCYRLKQRNPCTLRQSYTIIQLFYFLYCRKRFVISLRFEAYFMGQVMELRDRNCAQNGVQILFPTWQYLRLQTGMADC